MHGCAGKTWRCGVAAKATLATLIRGQVLQCLVIEEDPNGCYQSRCMREDGADLGAYMVRSGLALAKSDAYMAEETDAMRRRAGAWDGEFLPPWQWRSSCALRQMPLRNGPGGGIRVPA